MLPLVIVEQDIRAEKEIDRAFLIISRLYGEISPGLFSELQFGGPETYFRWVSAGQNIHSLVLGLKGDDKVRFLNWIQKNHRKLYLETFTEDLRKACCIMELLYEKFHIGVCSKIAERTAVSADKAWTIFNNTMRNMAKFIADIGGKLRENLKLWAIQNISMEEIEKVYTKQLPCFYDKSYIPEKPEESKQRRVHQAALQFIYKMYGITPDKNTTTSDCPVRSTGQVRKLMGIP